MSTTETNYVETKDVVGHMREFQSEERIRRNKIMTGVLSAYFGTPRDRTLEAEMDELIDSFILTRDAAELEESCQLGRLGEGRALVVVGESGAGKTRSLQRLFSRRQEFAPSEGGDGHRVLITVSAPPPAPLDCLARRFYLRSGTRPSGSFERTWCGNSSGGTLNCAGLGSFTLMSSSTSSKPAIRSRFRRFGTHSRG